MQDNTPLHLERPLTRTAFNKMTQDLVEKTITPLKRAMTDAKVSAAEIHQVLLVGGSTRIPAVQEAVKKELGKEPNKSINPDEVVAMGAAIQGGVITGDVKDVLLLDVTPLSLGIETLGGVLTTLIKRNTTIPTSKSQIFSTAADSQPAVDIHVLQGERPIAANNKTLGRFQLVGIDPAPRGVPQIEVTFTIDVNGIVSVKAKDIKTNKEQSITIQNSGNLTEEDIKKMVEEAEQNKEADEKLRKNLETMNQAEALLHQLEQGLTGEDSKKLNDEQKKEAEKARDELKKAIEGKDYDVLEKKVTEFQQAAEMMNQFMNQQKQEEATNKEVNTEKTDTEKSAKEDAVEAEVVDEEK